MDAPNWLSMSTVRAFETILRDFEWIVKPPKNVIRWYDQVFSFLGFLHSLLDLKNEMDLFL